MYTCSSCTSADTRELVRIRSRLWVGHRSSGCECRTVVVNPSALGRGAENVEDTRAHHQAIRRTVRIHVSTSIGGLSWRGGCSADGSDTRGGCVADANGCGGCSTATNSYTPHDTHHHTICRTPVGYMGHALWHYAFLCQKEQGSYCICKTIIANTMAPIIVSAPCKTIIAMQAGCWG